jgi:predicted dehydrogenase
VSAARLAIVGAGVIGKRHIAAIAGAPCADLVAIADPLPAAGALARENGIEWFANTPDMLAAAKPDGVIVATPTEHHLEPVLAALDAGAHALVEKPITQSLAQAEDIISRSAATGRHVLVGHHRRHYPVLHKARELVQGGALGQLVAVSGQWNVRKPPAYFEPGWRKKREAGPVLTNLVHELDSLRFICGDIASISAEMSSDILGCEKEDAAAIVIRFESGALGSFVLSDQTPSPWAWEFATGENPAFPRSAQNACRFMGTRAALDFPNLTLWTHEGGEPDWNHPMTAQAIDVDLGDAFAAQCRHFCAVITSDEAPRITAADAAKTLQATLAVFEAAQSGKRVALV